MNIEKMEKFEEKGIWWLPEKPDEKVAGTLNFDPRGRSTLDLIGAFRDWKEINELSKNSIILGVTHRGKNVTLYRCFETATHASMPGFVSSSYLIDTIFVGHHFEKVSDIVFKNISINYSYLEEWARVSGLKINLEHTPDSKFKKYEVIYTFPDEIKIKVKDFTISLVSECTPHMDFVKEINLKETLYLRIEPSECMHIDDLQMDICYHIQNFFSLAIGEAVYPITIKGKTESCKSILPNGQTAYHDIFVFYSERGMPESFKKLHALEALFALKDIRNIFEMCLRNWITKADILRPVYDLYFGTLYNSEMYLQHEFLTLTQALESYHRRTKNNYKLPEDEYKMKLQDILKAVPENYRVWLGNKLVYGNEPTLRERLVEILGQLKDISGILIEDNDKFADNVVNTRNYLTHYDKSLEEKAKFGEKLYVLVQKIKFLLEICFLVELELPAETVKKLVSRNHRYQFLKRNIISGHS